LYINLDNSALHRIPGPLIGAASGCALALLSLLSFGALAVSRWTVAGSQCAE